MIANELRRQADAFIDLDWSSSLAAPRPNGQSRTSRTIKSYTCNTTEDGAKGTGMGLSGKASTSGAPLRRLAALI
jgi:hypothetical protein